MKLSQDQISAILKTKARFFPEAKIYLFGSRILEAVETLIYTSYPKPTLLMALKNESIF